MEVVIIITIILTSILVQVLGLALNYSIIWFERSLPEVRRTLLNRLLALQCTLCIFVSAVNLDLNMVIVLGSYGEAACDAAIAVRLALFYSFYFVADLIMVLRFLYARYFRHAVQFNDDLLFTFSTVLSAAFPAQLAAMAWFSGALRYTQWHLCAYGEEAGVNDHEAGVDKLWIVIWPESISLTLHIALCSAILWTKRKEAAVGDKAPPISSMNLPVAYSPHDVKKGIIGISASVGMFVLIVVAHNTFPAVLTQGFSFSDLQLTPYMEVWVGFVLSGLIPGYYLAVNSELRRKVCGRALKALHRTTAAAATAPA